MKKYIKKNKKSKKHKKDKDINVSNKINIKIDTGDKKGNKRNKTKSSSKERIKQYPQYPQYPTYTQYNPAPELDYNALARAYLQEEPRSVREHLLLENARPEGGERAPLKSKISGIKINTPKKLFGGIKKISKNERVVELNKESLMKVKTLKELKDIFIQNGAPADRVKLLIREADRGRAVDEFLKYLSNRDYPRTAAGGAGEAVSKATPDIKKREMKMLSSVKAFHGGKSPPLRGGNLFPSQEAKTGSMEEMKSGTPITGNLYDVLREENSDSDSDSQPKLKRDDPLNREFLRLRERTASIIATARKKLEGKEPMRSSAPPPPPQVAPPRPPVSIGIRGGPILGPPGRGRAPGRPPIPPTPTLNLQELGNYRPFQSQQATTPAGGAVPRDQSSISGNFYNALNIDD